MSRPRKRVQPDSRMQFGRCRACRFWVSRQDRHCANCGLVGPHPQRDHTYLALIKGFTVGGGILGSFAVFVGMPVDTILPSLFWGGCVGAPLGSVVDGFVRDLRRESDCLQAYERTIKLRLQEIDGVINRIDIVREHLGPRPGPELQPVVEVLRTAERIYPEHRDQYRLKLLEIDLVRWQNSLEPLGLASEGLTFEQCERRLNDLDTLQRRGAALAEHWTTTGLGISASREMRTRLERGQALCEEIRQNLITRQALSVVSGVTTLEAEATSVARAHVELGLDRMTARAELGEFIQSLTALEAEHARLEAELEVNRLSRG